MREVTRKICYFMVLVMLFSVFAAVPKLEKVSAESQVITYSANPFFVSKFRKKNGKLLIKTTSYFGERSESAAKFYLVINDHDIPTHKTKLKYKLAKHVKYTFYDDFLGTHISKSSYKEVKAYLNRVNTMMKEAPDIFDSDCVMLIRIKKNKIIEIRFVML